jgi:hypothetical protein
MQNFNARQAFDFSLFGTEFLPNWNSFIPTKQL